MNCCSDRLIAVGDIHGQLEKLQSLINKVGTFTGDQWIFLGDYVDRGPNSAGVLDYLIEFEKRFPKTIFLRGNHEYLMLDAINESGIETGVPFLSQISETYDRILARSRAKQKNCVVWKRNGAEETMNSYGYPMPKYSRIDDGDSIAPKKIDYFESFLNIPKKHIFFLSKTKLWHKEKNFIFVHAGLDDAKNMSDQDPYNFLWSRNSLWPYTEGWTKTVVHGHTICHSPIFSKYEINIDTGAGEGKDLTCCNLFSNEVWKA